MQLELKDETVPDSEHSAALVGVAEHRSAVPKIVEPAMILRNRLGRILEAIIEVR